MWMRVGDTILPQGELRKMEVREVLAAWVLARPDRGEWSILSESTRGELEILDCRGLAS